MAAPGNGTDPAGGLVFDEKYYVNAARVIDHIPVPCPHGQHPPCDPYGNLPLGIDPNSEHPPLGKLFIAAGIKLLGDNPLGWRLFPVVFGSLAILALFWLVRAAGGGRWLALGSAALMAADNLFLVHGRIATLDVFVLVFMLVAVALYLRGHPLVAGVALGVGACVKLVAPFVVFVLFLLEAGRVLVRREWRGGWGSALGRLFPLLSCTAVAVAVYLGLLQGLDLAVHPWHRPDDPCPGTGTSFATSLEHTRFMLCYASKLTSPNGPVGIESYPWQWLLDQAPINYYSLNVSVTSGGDTVVHHPIAFTGLMNPAIILLALPCLGLAVHSAWRGGDDVSLLVIAWALGTFLPFAVDAAVEHRKSYLYYMVVVLPAVYLGVARLLSVIRPRLPVLAGYVAILGYEFVSLYPFQTWLV